MDGNKIAQSTGIDLLLQSNFDLKINDTKYRVEVPEDGEYCGATFGYHVSHVQFNTSV